MKLGDEFFISSLSFFFFFRRERDSEFFLGPRVEEFVSLNYRPRSTLCDHRKREKKVLFSCERDYTLRTFNGLK